MRITIVVPESSRSYSFIQPPWGVLKTAAVMEKMFSCQVTVIDNRVERLPIKPLIERVKVTAPDLLMCTTNTYDQSQVYILGPRLHRIFDTVKALSVLPYPYVVCGPHLTSHTDLFMKEASFDIGLKGQFDITLPAHFDEICKTLHDKSIGAKKNVRLFRIFEQPSSQSDELVRKRSLLINRGAPRQPDEGFQHHSRRDLVPQKTSDDIQIIPAVLKERVFVLIAVKQQCAGARGRELNTVQIADLQFGEDAERFSERIWRLTGQAEHDVGYRLNPVFADGFDRLHSNVHRDVLVDGLKRCVAKGFDAEPHVGTSGGGEIASDLVIYPIRACLARESQVVVAEFLNSLAQFLHPLLVSAEGVIHEPETANIVLGVKILNLFEDRFNRAQLQTPAQE